ncbi:class I SAM-dependent methyltransferase [Marinibacterium profundimaris]|uniref:Methyltransferase domain-containing protein n=1 Tax=Marinibacterium profundimaris TaxID=1679460 RepID=A0A225NBW1_9RHOB|nr:class I SAM-dependent methyltransferase [Marinibacterium profundimaris]OWU68407.1 hypothetical protein ATO3_24295 [Marinibacterium profundimaris]
MQQNTVDLWDQGWAPLYDDMDNVRSPNQHTAFYVGLVTPGTGSLLDLGSGTGSITAPVVEKMREGGADRPAVGVDLAPAMVELAAARYPAIDWRLGDIKCPPVAPEERFDLVICCFHTMQALRTEADMAESLSNIRDALAPDGRFAFDIYQPNRAYLAKAAAGGLEDGRVVREFSDRTGRRLRVREYSTYDPETLLFSGTWYLHDGVTDARLPLEPMDQTLRQYFASDMERLLADAGLQIVERYGDLDRSPFTPEAKRQVIVCGQG